MHGPSLGSRRAVTARLVLALALAAAAIGSIAALGSARKVFRSAASLRHETQAMAEDRLFGAAYMASIRRIRTAVGVEETLFLVDGESEERGAPYFVLYALAPRRVVLLGRLREEPLRRLQRRLPDHARWVVTAGDGQTPPKLQTAAEFRGR